MFSTITMVPSTISPMAMASPPRLIRFAEIPNQCMPTTANSTENGMAAATTTLGRNPPMNTNRTSTTRTIPWKSASETVSTAFWTRVFCS